VSVAKADVVGFVGDGCVCCCGVDDPAGGVAHGEETRGGSGSNVKIEAISRVCPIYARSGGVDGLMAKRTTAGAGRGLWIRLSYETHKRDNDRELVCEKWDRNSFANRGSILMGSRAQTMYPSGAGDISCCVVAS
jgi:hypothetical protein